MCVVSVYVCVCFCGNTCLLKIKRFIDKTVGWEEGGGLFVDVLSS